MLIVQDTKKKSFFRFSSIHVPTLCLSPQDSHMCVSCVASQRCWSRSAGCLSPAGGSTWVDSSCPSNWPGPSPSTRVRSVGAQPQRTTRTDIRRQMLTKSLAWHHFLFWGSYCSVLPWDTSLLCVFSFECMTHLINGNSNSISLKEVFSFVLHLVLLLESARNSSRFDCGVWTGLGAQSLSRLWSVIMVDNPFIRWWMLKAISEI